MEATMQPKPPPLIKPYVAYFYLIPFKIEAMNVASHLVTLVPANNAKVTLVTKVILFLQKWPSFFATAKRRIIWSMSDEISKRGSSSASVLKSSNLKAPPRPSKYAQVSHKIVLLTIAIALNQCDQMARLFEFFCPFMTLKYFQITNKLP